MTVFLITSTPIASRSTPIRKLTLIAEKSLEKGHENSRSSMEENQPEFVPLRDEKTPTTTTMAVPLKA